MKTILIYDTETTGLPDLGKPSEDPCQPRVTQLCAELCDDESGEVLAAFHSIIKPDGWTIPADLEKLTGITNERAKAHGIPMPMALSVFMDMWWRAELRVAHNESFDMRMVRIELVRDKNFDINADGWKAGKAFCTQAQSQAICKLPPTQRMLAAGRRGPKPPNLGEAYKHFTGQELLNAHNATVDVMACKAVYFGIKKHARAAA